jgi:hypothetical protein
MALSIGSEIGFAGYSGGILRTLREAVGGGVGRGVGRGVGGSHPVAAMRDHVQFDE